MEIKMKQETSVFIIRLTLNIKIEIVMTHSLIDLEKEKALKLISGSITFLTTHIWPNVEYYLNLDKDKYSIWLDTLIVQLKNKKMKEFNRKYTL